MFIYSKFKRVLAFLFSLFTFSAAPPASAGLWDDENLDNGTEPTSSVAGALGNQSSAQNPSCCTTTNGNENGNINLGFEVNSNDNPTGGLVNVENITLEFDSRFSSPQLAQIFLSNSMHSQTQVTPTTYVLLTQATKNNREAIDELLRGLPDSFKLENGIAALVLPTTVKGVVIQKTIALGIPAGLMVAQDPFKMNTNILTSKGVEFFNGIKLYDGDLAVVTGVQAKANAVAAQLVANGANSEQLLVIPNSQMENPNTVAVYIVRLPTMEDLFTSPA